MGESATMRRMQWGRKRIRGSYHEREREYYPERERTRERHVGEPAKDSNIFTEGESATVIERVSNLDVCVGAYKKHSSAVKNGSDDRIRSEGTDRPKLGDSRFIIREKFLRQQKHPSIETTTRSMKEASKRRTCTRTDLSQPPAKTHSPSMTTEKMAPSETFADVIKTPSFHT